MRNLSSTTATLVLPLPTASSADPAGEALTTAITTIADEIVASTFTTVPRVTEPSQQRQTTTILHNLEDGEVATFVLPLPTVAGSEGGEGGDGGDGIAGLIMSGLRMGGTGDGAHATGTGARDDGNGDEDEDETRETAVFDGGAAGSSRAVGGREGWWKCLPSLGESQGLIATIAVVIVWMM